jgi:hypothetical protein
VSEQKDSGLRKGSKTRIFHEKGEHDVTMPLEARINPLAVKYTGFCAAFFLMSSQLLVQTTSLALDITYHITTTQRVQLINHYSIIPSSQRRSEFGNIVNPLMFASPLLCNFHNLSRKGQV